MKVPLKRCTLAPLGMAMQTDLFLLVRLAEPAVIVAQRGTLMAFLSFSEVRDLSASVRNRRSVFNESKASTPTGSIFLSHSSADDEFVEGVVVLLSQFCIPVYTDNHDHRLPSPPDVQTAVILKDEIKKSRRFIVLVSPNSRSSRWIPWELGLADGYKDIPPIGILPITLGGVEENWAKEEYFGLYPRIYFISGTGFVLDPRDGKPWSLKFWLTGS
jgi:hypothetical protein